MKMFRKCPVFATVYSATFQKSRSNIDSAHTKMKSCQRFTDEMSLSPPKYQTKSLLAHKKHRVFHFVSIVVALEYHKFVCKNKID